MTDARKLRVGVLVNPIAGLGGRAGLKGSDEPQRVAPLIAAAEWNDETQAYARGVAFVKVLDRARMVLVTPPGALGEDVVKTGTKYGGPVFEIARLPGPVPVFGQTTAADTARYVQRLIHAHVDLLVFVGGDGTAADVARAANDAVAVLGVPAGVKMFSAVFAETPEVAASLVNRLAPGFATRAVDVLDLDERSYREGGWIVRSHGAARIPDEPGIQAGKGGALGGEAEALEDLAAWFRQHRKEGVAYALGSGTTVAALKKDLGGGTPLGVDVWRDGAWMAEDADEAALLETLGEQGEAEIIVSPTGIQGAVLGRGTAQISVPVIERVGVGRVVVIATPQKLLGLSHLFVDTGDPELDASFPDYVKVRTDAFTEKVFPLKKGVKLGAR